MIAAGARVDPDEQDVDPAARDRDRAAPGAGHAAGHRRGREDRRVGVHRAEADRRGEQVGHGGDDEDRGQAGTGGRPRTPVEAAIEERLSRGQDPPGEDDRVDDQERDDRRRGQGHRQELRKRHDLDDEIGDPDQRDDRGRELGGDPPAGIDELAATRQERRQEGGEDAPLVAGTIVDLDDRLGLPARSSRLGRPKLGVEESRVAPAGRWIAIQSPDRGRPLAWWIAMDSVGLHAGATPAAVSGGGRSRCRPGQSLPA